jgi:predicted nuclease of predicted toxin-antitoxin system
MQSDDQSIWNYPRAKGLVIVSKDADFAERSFLHGHPPKVVWIRTGNWSKLEMQRLLSDALPKIEAFAGSS